MKLPLEFYEELREKLDIVEEISPKVRLRKQGRGEYSGLCPFHSERTPSFTVNMLKKFYHCFGCSAHGDVIKFEAETSGLSYKEAAIKLAEKNGISLPEQSPEQQNKMDSRNQIYRLLENVQKEYEQSLWHKQGINAREYLSKRGVSQETITKFRLGYSPRNSGLITKLKQQGFTQQQLLKAGIAKQNTAGDEIYEFIRNRITFPIINIYNRVIAYGSRLLDSEDNGPKYLNSPETEIFKKSEVLYGENLAFKEAREKNFIIVVEGYTDVIFMHQYGFTNVVASLGTAITTNHLSRLWKNFDEIVLCMDGDPAGTKAATRAIELALPYISSGKKLSFITLTPGYDPDDILKNSGAGKIQEFIQNRLSASEYIWEISHNQIIGDKTKILPEDKSDLEKKLFEYTSLINDNSYKYNIGEYFKNKLWQLTKNRQQNYKNYGASGSKYKNNSTTNPLEQSAKNLSRDFISNLPPGFSGLHENNKLREAVFLEHCLLAEILHHPNILQDSEIEEKLARANFNDDNLAGFKDFLLEYKSEIAPFEDQNTSENMQDLFKKAGFLDTFNLLSCENSGFYDKISVREDYKKSWLSIFYKYNLANLKHEYCENLKYNNSESYERAMAVLSEIQELEQFLYSFTSSEED